MTFSSVVFLFAFLPVTFGLYALIPNITARNVLLTAASLGFYAFGEPKAVFIMIISICLNYVFGRLAAGDKFAKAAVAAAVILNIGLLAVFKYLGFFMSGIDRLAGGNLAVPDIALPIGISFFTFQGLSYVIDCYRKEVPPQKNLLYVFLYISFFPQLIAGPIIKYKDIENQLSKREFTSQRVADGVTRFIIGLGKKVLISNNMGLVADTVFSYSPDELNMISAWIGAISYMMQIFFDFSGYSDMAIGLGCMFGFDFNKNFNYPYISTSMREFWRRWHISLSTWFKEYVYIPLGGNRKGKIRAVINRLIVFFLTGLWHGANLTFIVWGLLHGGCMLIEGVAEGFVSKLKGKSEKNTAFKVLSHLYVLLVVAITFVIFRADTLSQGFGIIAHMFSVSRGTGWVNAEISSRLEPVYYISLFAAIVLSMPVVPKLRGLVSQTRFAAAADVVSHICVLGIFALSVLMVATSSYNPFIYFRF